MGWSSLNMKMKKTPLCRRKRLSRIWSRLLNLMLRILRKNSWRASLIWVNWMPRLRGKISKMKEKKKTEISLRIPVCSHRRTPILTSSSWRRACLTEKFRKSARWIKSRKWRQMKSGRRTVLRMKSMLWMSNRKNNWKNQSRSQSSPTYPRFYKTSSRIKK